MFGCGPNVGVKSDTKMCHDFSQALLDGLNDHKYVEFPDLIKSIEESDARFEVSMGGKL